RRNIERLAPHKERNQTAQGGEGNDTQDQHGLTELSELGVEQEQHHSEHKAENQREPTLRPLLILELSGKFEAILGLIEMHRLRNLLFHLGQVGYEVAVGEVDANGQVATIVRTRDGAFAVSLGDFCDL